MSQDTPPEINKNTQNVRSNQPSSQEKNALFSPKKVAQAIGVSESSLKRWCDAGKIGGIKTAGGHRRFNRANIVEFLKSKNYELRDPTLIGLPNFEALSVADASDGVRQMLEGIIADDEAQVTKLVVFLYLNGWSVAEIFDQIVSPTFNQVGDMWKRGELEVYQERRGCEICLNAFRELRSMLLTAAPDSMTAVGGTLEGDHYLLPTLSVELTLTSLGWNANSLGSNLPVDSLFRAVDAQQPDLVWISISHLENQSDIANRINELSKKMPPVTTLVVGGSALHPSMRTNIEHAICCDNLSQLVAFVSKLKKPNDMA